MLCYMLAQSLRYERCVWIVFNFDEVDSASSILQFPLVFTHETQCVGRTQQLQLCKSLLRGLTYQVLLIHFLGYVPSTIQLINAPVFVECVRHIVSDAWGLHGILISWQYPQTQLHEDIGKIVQTNCEWIQKFRVPKDGWTSSRTQWWLALTPAIFGSALQIFIWEQWHRHSSKNYHTFVAYYLSQTSQHSFREHEWGLQVKLNQHEHLSFLLKTTEILGREWYLESLREPNTTNNQFENGWPPRVFWVQSRVAILNERPLPAQYV